MGLKFILFPHTNAILLLLLLVFTQMGFSQNVGGIVLDKESEAPLENVNIYIEKTIIGTTTSEKGKFNLRLDSFSNRPDSLTLSIVGYKTLKIAISDLNSKTNRILMSELTNELGEVIVGGKRKLQEKLSYKELSSLKKGVFAFGSTIVDDKIYVIGGSESFTEDTMRKAIDKANSKYINPTYNQVLNEMEPNGSNNSYNNNLLVYDFGLDQWQTTDINFEDRAHHRLNKVDNKIYALGGKRTAYNGSKEYLLNKIEILSLDSLKVITDDVNPHQAVDFASFAYKDNLLVMGGSNKMTKNGHKTFTDECHFFNITTGYWYELEKMTKPKETNGVIIEDKVYLIGGFNGEALSEIESLDLTTGKWKKEGNLFYGMENPSVTTHDGLIYIFNFGKLFIYDTLKGSLKAYDIDLFIKDPNLHYHQNKLYVLGGYTEEKYSKSPSSKLFEIDLGQLAKTKIQNSKDINM